jgi:3-oxoacyl-[acyl-carrier protein] reductase
MEQLVAVVTGASRGIGRSIAISLAKKGYHVLINYCTSEGEARKVLKEVGAYSSGTIYKADISDAEQVRNMVQFIKERYGVIDVLVNNAGKILRPGNWDIIDDDAWDMTYKINAKGMYMCTRMMADLFRKDRIGHIVNISSTVGESGASPVIAYSAAKAATINMTKSFAAAFAPNITVNSVAPGNIDTEITSSAGKELVDWIVNMTPMRRLGTTQEVADLVVFPCSEQANFITGQVIDIDGGYSWRK